MENGFLKQKHLHKGDQKALVEVKFCLYILDLIFAYCGGGEGHNLDLSIFMADGENVNDQ